MPRTRFLPCLIAAFLALVAVSGNRAAAAPHIVVDLKSGKVISQEQAFDRWYPASLTKLMTVYTVFREIRKGNITALSPVMVSANAAAEPPSRMGFPVGSILNVDAAIKILMVKSANDIATATAESVGGSEAAFAGLMNANARELGMSESNFVNAHGLHDDRQYTSARDLAILTLAIRKEFPSYASYFSIPAIQTGGRAIANHNQLLFRFSGTTGMKTGFVCSSGLNIVVTAKRNGKELVAVVLGGTTGQERSVRAARLLTEGFSKNAFFLQTKIQSLRPAGFVNRSGTDLRDEVCKAKPRKAKGKSAKGKGGKNKKVAIAAPEPEQAPESGEDSAFALGLPSGEPTLDELELKYLGPRLTSLPAGKVMVVSLGNATGPDPYGLVETGAALTKAREAAEAAAARVKAEKRAKKAAAAKVAKAAKKAKAAAPAKKSPS